MTRVLLGRPSRVSGILLSARGEGHHEIDGATLRQSLLRVAQYRDIALSPLSTALVDYASMAQQRWLAWLKKQRLDATVSTEFSAVLELAALFADPVCAGDVTSGTWMPDSKRWMSHR